MIKKLRRQIILILTTFIALIGLLIVVAINYNSYSNLKDTCYYQVERSINFNTEGSNINMNMISLVRTENGYALYYNSTGMSTEDIYSLLSKIEDQKTNMNHIGSYYYLNLGNMIRILDFKDLYNSYYHSLLLSVVIYIVVLAGSLFFTTQIANHTVKPVEEAFDKQKKFISDVSHELKTPIAIIQTNTELLQMDGTNKQLDYISYESGRMNQLINKLLQLTRIESNPAYSELNKGNLSYVVSRAAMPFESLVFEKGFTLECNIDENIEGMFNEGLVEQLVTILLDNAIKHTKEKGKIEINLKQHSKKAILFVEDEGDEISKEDQKNVFERFYRVDSARNRSDNRYGLGLAIAKSIVEVHHGSISVESGNGKTKFIATLSLN